MRAQRDEPWRAPTAQPVLPRPPTSPGRISSSGAWADADAPPWGTEDAEILIWCEINGTSPVTNNRRSMPRHLRDHLLAGGHVPAIFLLTRGLTIGDVAERLALVSGASDGAKYLDQLMHLAQIT